MRQTKRVSLLGVEFDRVTMERMIAVIEASIASNAKVVIANHNLHSIYLFHRLREMREFYAAAEVVQVDGMPLVALAKFIGYAVSRVHRVTYADLIDELARTAGRNHWPLVYLGSRPGVAEEGVRRLKSRHPGLEMYGMHGYFDVDDRVSNDAVVAKINALSPRIVMVGMGMPRQELWIMRNRAAVNANVFLPSGACIDYVAGVVRTPPRWAGRIGLEWLFRLISEPRRLSRRYLLEPWTLLPLLVKDLRTRCVNRGRDAEGA